MRAVWQVVAGLAVGGLMLLIFNSQKPGPPPDPEAAARAALENPAVRDVVARQQAVLEELEAADPGQIGDEDFSPGAVILQPGETRAFRSTYKLPMEIFGINGGFATDGHFYDSLEYRVVENEWQDAGVRVRVTGLRVESYLFDMWMIDKTEGWGVFRVKQPPLSLEEAGRLEREEIARMLAAGMEFDGPEGFDPTFDLSREKGLGYRVTVNYTVTVPADIALEPRLEGRAGTVYLATQFQDIGLCFTLRMKRGHAGMSFAMGDRWRRCAYANPRHRLYAGN